MFLLPKTHWEIRKTAQRGRGIFAALDIQPGVIIGDYLGRIISPDEESESDRGLYAMWYSERATILPDPDEIGVHLINHACMPNCAMYTHRGHTLYFALRRIFKGEELTASYLLDPTDDDPNAPCFRHACSCRSPICHGTLHTSKIYIDRWNAMEARRHKNRFASLPVPYGQRLPKLDVYPAVIEDDPLYEIFGSLEQTPLECSEAALPGIAEIRKRIRRSGRCLAFGRLRLLLYGIMQGLIVAASALPKRR